MGSSGGGSAGQVDYPDYIKNVHHAILNNTDSDVLSLSAFDLLNAIAVDSPYDSATSYTGRTEIGTPGLSVAQVITELLTMNSDPFDQFRATFPQIGANVQDLFDSDQLQTAIEKDSVKADPEYNKMLQTYDSLELPKGTAFSSARILGRTQVLDAKMRTVMAESLDNLSKGIIQLGNNKLGDALAVADMQLETFRIGKTAYTMAVEMCKLSILNEREYFEQAEFYAKYAAHWKFEQYQEVSNAISKLQMGKKLTWVSTPDIPAWGQALALSLFASMGDAPSFHAYKTDRYNRHVTTSAGLGFVGGGLTSGPGAIVGGIAGMISGILSYSEGDWR